MPPPGSGGPSPSGRSRQGSRPCPAPAGDPGPPPARSPRRRSRYPACRRRSRSTSRSHTSPPTIGCGHCRCSRDDRPHPVWVIRRDGGGRPGLDAPAGRLEGRGHGQGDGRHHQRQQHDDAGERNERVQGRLGQGLDGEGAPELRGVPVQRYRGRRPTRPRTPPPRPPPPRPTSASGVRGAPRWASAGARSRHRRGGVPTGRARRETTPIPFPKAPSGECLIPTG